MNKIVIAIPQMGNSLFRKYMKSKYTESLERAGGKYVWLDLTDPAKAAERACECSGLLMPGGADVDPLLYGEKRTEKCGKPNETRDAAEPVVFKAFLETGKPILCICRGIQIMNVVFGGTLKQDIKSEQKCNHADFLNRARFTHAVEIKKDTILHSIVKSDKISVNSIHHQAIDTLAAGLKLSAVSEDGFVEGAELESYGFCLGVQWHPEHMSKKDPVQQELFNRFISECRG